MVLRNIWTKIRDLKKKFKKNRNFYKFSKKSFTAFSSTCLTSKIYFFFSKCVFSQILRRFWTRFSSWKNNHVTKNFIKKIFGIIFFIKILFSSWSLNRIEICSVLIFTSWRKNTEKISKIKKKLKKKQKKCPKNQESI